LFNRSTNPAKTSLAEALGFFVYASNAWNAHITGGTNLEQLEALGRNPLLDKCEPLRRQLHGKVKNDGSIGDVPPLPFVKRGSAKFVSLGLLISTDGIQPLLDCASERVAAAEGLVRGR
jgi:hypothetical protein